MKILFTLFMTTIIATAFGQVKWKKMLTDFVPKGYIIQNYEGGVFIEKWNEIKGDLNKDSLEDIVLMIKGTDSGKIVTDPHNPEKKLDRNRRGILVLFNKKDYYELALKNYDCFSSENEDGGNYYAPEVFIEIKKGNLCIIYSHGRNGYWRYTFRFQNSDFELIGYDASNNRGPVTESQISINFSTKKKRVDVNTNPDADDGGETFKTTWRKIKLDRLVKLSKIKNFDELDMSIY